MQLRNLAIIAHVDHGKTTQVDALLKQSGAVRSNQAVAERAMDSGEVERILSMVDGALLLVDAAEGPMPQTKFVTMKAPEQGLCPIVVVNKTDKPDAVVDAVFDLFAALDADEAQLDFPVLYASAKEGWAVAELDDPRTSLEPLFERIVEHVPPPVCDPDGPFRMLATTLESDPFLGRVLTGRIDSGSIAVGETVKGMTMDGSTIEQARLTKLLAFRGLRREPVERATAGDIVAVAGLTRTTVADTIAVPAVTEALPARPVSPPTMAMTVSVNDGPLAGQDGTRLASRMIRDRLSRESEGNVAIRVSDTDDADTFEVAGRGELQLGVLVETMRREGFELVIGPPKVLFTKDPETGAVLEPMEEVQIDVDEAFTGPVVEGLSERRAALEDMRPSGGGKTQLRFIMPSRGLIGYHGTFLAVTRGTGILSRLFHGYAPHKGPIPGRRAGVLISAEKGKSVAYALWNLEERGALFIDPGDAVYPGMIIGEHNKGQDLEVNPLKAKQLTNIRAAGKDEAVRLTTPLRLGLEQSIAYIQDDERVEVTPNHIRLRKAILDPHERKRVARQRKAEAG